MIREKVGLLPYIREDVYGHTTQSSQHVGWEIEKMGIEKLWKKGKGKGCKVAVIDTGCDLDHPDIAPNLLQGKNFVNEKKDPWDDNGHGSHVCGTVAAIDNGLGIVGVAPEAKVIPIKALGSDGSGTMKDIAKAIVWAADNDANFITMSLGSPFRSENINLAIDYAVAKKCVVFCAAGNSGPTKNIMFPAATPSTIAIGAIDRNLNRTSFTCAGEPLDFLAPGHDIMSLVPDNNYALMSGTSMSNPFAVGCAALLYGELVRRKRTYVHKQSYYISRFKENAISLKQEKYRNKKYQGYGIINLKAL